MGFLLAALADPTVRAEIEKIALAAFAMIIHRRNTDPQFLATSDAAFSAYSSVVANPQATQEEKDNALRAISQLNSSP